MPWQLTGNAGTNAKRNFLGTTDSRPLVIETVGVERVRVLGNGNVGLGTQQARARLTVANGGAFINGVGVDAPAINYAYESSGIGLWAKTIGGPLAALLTGKVQVKRKGDRGRYLNPELHGGGEEQSVHRPRLPGRRAEVR